MYINNNFDPEKIKNRNIFLVCGGQSFIKSGAKSWLGSLFNNNRVTTFSDFKVNPEVSDLQKGLVLFNSINPDLVLAIGGGSVLDMAKLIRFFGIKEQDLTNWIKTETLNPIESPDKIPLLAIPTTSGTGAEATHFSVLYKNKVKFSVAHKDILPDEVVLKAELTLAMNPFLTAVTGLDAFFQAVEGWWSKGSTQESREYSVKAISLILLNLKKSVQEGDLASRKALLEASHFAGKAINMAKTTACHAFSYILTSTFGLPHGQAVAVTFPFILNYNLSLMADKEARELKEILSLGSESPLIWAEHFLGNLGIDFKLTCTEEDLISLFNENVNLERLSNNPVEIDANTIKKMAAFCVE